MHSLSLQYAVQAIWKAVRDLLQPRHAVDVRHVVFRLTQAMVAGQYSELGVMRAHFFKVIQSHQLEEDAQQRCVCVCVHMRVCVCMHCDVCLTG